MIQTYAHQKELYEARLRIKTIEGMFVNLITEGPRPHVRRAHWHTYRTGTGRMNQILKWLPPIPINLDIRNACQRRFIWCRNREIDTEAHVC